MSRLAKLFVLVQVLANAACEPPVEPVIADFATEVVGTWDYAASFLAATVVGDSVTCEIAGVTITASNPLEISGRISTYGFDAEASGGAVECAGDRTDDFVQELPAHVAVELRSSPFWVLLNFTFPTPLGLMQVENLANPDFASADDVISADYWNGRVVATVIAASFNGRGRFTAVKR